MRKLRVLIIAVSLGCSLALAGCSDDGNEKKKESTCEAGTASCVCLDDGSCDGDLTCQEGICQAADAAGLQVASADARGCSVLLKNTASTRVVDITFSPEVKGTFVRQGDRTALSFISATDAAIPAGAVQVATLGGSADEVAVARADCSDRLGKTLADVQVSLR